MSNPAKPYPKSKQLARGSRKYRRTVASNPTWQKLRDEKLGPCRVCNLPAKYSELHHVIPRDFHGDDVADNLVPLCPYHHELVHDLNEHVCRLFLYRLTDAEYAYAIEKMGEAVFERVYRIRYER